MNLDITVVNVLVSFIYIFILALVILIMLTQWAVYMRTRGTREFRYFAGTAGLTSLSGASFLVAFSAGLLNLLTMAQGHPAIPIVRIISAVAFLMALVLLSAACTISFLYWSGALWFDKEPPVVPVPKALVVHEPTPKGNGSETNGKS